MAASELTLPQLGEAITEGTITKWFKAVGDRVEVDEILYEVSTEKVDSEVPSPMAGVIAELKVEEGETVEVGAVLALIEADAGAPAPAPAEPSAPPVAESSTESSIESSTESSTQPAATAPRAEIDGRLLSPLVRRLIRENGLDASQLSGTGVGGRISRDDVLAAIDKMRQNGAPAPAAVAQDGASASAQEVIRPGPASVQPQVWEDDGDSRFEPFTKIRKTTGERMVASAQTVAYVQTVMEIDYENVDRERRKHRAAFKEAEGFSLTYLPFIVLAAADALSEWPLINASVVSQDGEPGLVVHRNLNIGIAVDLNHTGLIVPVLRQADTLNLRGAARAMNDLAGRARDKKLRPDDITGGTFTISNNGSFGTYTTSAIINQPQVCVLSTEGVARRPAVAEDEYGNESIVIHSVGHLSLGWDHRAFDGGYAAGFLGRVKQLLETHEWAAEF